MSSTKILLFTSASCGPCRMIKSNLTDEMISELGIEFVDSGKDFDHFIQYQVQSVPTIIKVVDGVETKRLIGFKTNEEIRSL